MMGLRRGNPRSRGGIKLTLVLFAAVVLAAGASYALLGRGGSANDKHSKTEKKKDKKKDSEHAEDITYIKLGAFLVNLASSNDLRYLRTEVTLGVQVLKPPKKGGHGGDEEPELPPATDARIRDTIVRILSRQSFDKVRAHGPDEELKKAIIKELSGTVKDCKVVTVLFTSFVMQ